MLDLGDRLSSYEPLWENWHKDIYIGGGNFGKVYRLKTELYGETIYTAVKIIPVMLEQELESVEDKTGYVENKKQAMVQEIINMYRLKDKPHLVQCINHGTKDILDDSGEVIGFDILIQMNFYRSLTSYMKEKGQLNPDEIKRLAQQIADGLKSMHEINMLHRDIKIENIYVDKDGKFLLGDFGIAKQEALSRYSTLAGTQPFIAPEVWKVQNTNRRYTKTADIYSYGISLYYLLNGNRLPLVEKGFTKNQIDEAVFDRLNGKSFLAPEKGDEQLKSVVMKCCAYEPESRFQSMGEIIEALGGSVFEPVSTSTRNLENQYATMFAGKETATQSFSAPTYERPTYTNDSYIYHSQNGQPQGTFIQPAVQTQPNSTNKMIIALVSIVALLLVALIALMVVFMLKSGSDSSSAPAAEITQMTEDSILEVEATTTTTAPPETTTTTTTKATTTTTTSITTTTTTKATTASKIKTLKKPDRIYGGIEEGDIYNYTGSGVSLYYGPDSGKYDKTSIYISAFDIIQEHGRLKDGSWLYVSVYGSGECGWIQNKDLAEITEYPGMSDQTGYLGDYYTAVITKDTAYRRGPNDIRDPIPGYNTLKKGSAITVVGSCPGWYYIYYGGNTDGWVKSDCVEFE